MAEVIEEKKSMPSPQVSVAQGPVEEAIRSASESDYRQYGISQDDIDKAVDEACTLSLEDARAHLTEYLVEHGDDMLIPSSFTEAVRDLVSRVSVSDEKIDQPLEAEARVVAGVFHGNSVYREVRAMFPNTDDVNEPCGTVRAYVIGIIWAAGLAGLNQFFAPRNPTLSIDVYIAQLFAYPMGRFCAAILPTTVFLKGSRFEFTLNPGPFTVKEHMLITIMSNVSSGSVAHVTPIFFEQYLPMFFNQSYAGGWGYQICVMLAVQIFGFGLAGMIRRFLIYAPQMIYYFTLSQAALNNALHNANDSFVNGWRISRFKFFFVVFGIMFVYYWFPGTIFPVLTFFNWMTWIAPKNATLSILMGNYYYNLGLNPLLNSFDWNWFAGVVDPIVNPFFIVFQIVAACFVWAIAVVIPVFFTNTWYTAYMPINSWLLYDNTGAQYQSRKVMSADYSFNQTAYEHYSPLFIPATYILRYAVQFATVPAVLTFTYLWYGKTMKNIAKNAWRRMAGHAGHNDIHSRLMSRYPEVPETWYIAVGALGAAFSFAAIYGWPTGTPGWTVPVVLILSIFFVIPVGAVEAVSGYEVTLEPIFNLVGGYAMNGRPTSLLLFKAMGLGVLMQALAFAKDQKLAHYVKIPPYHMFAAQLSATAISSFVILAVVNFQLGVKGMCNPAVQVHWVCGSAQTGFSTSLNWGLLGPERLFTHVDALYWKIMFGFLAGALWPIPWYIAKKYWPNSPIRYVHPVVLLMGGIMWAPMNLSQFWQALFFSYFFGVWVKNRYPGWWAKYALVLSTALTGGIAMSALVQFFAITYPGITFPAWWGSTYHTSTCDFRDCRYLKPPVNGTFGPTEWH